MKLSNSEISNLDKWIEQLKSCKPLEEMQVKQLCEKVTKIIFLKQKIFIFLSKFRQKKSSSKNPTSKASQPL